MIKPVAHAKTKRLMQTVTSLSAETLQNKRPLDPLPLQFRLQILRPLRPQKPETHRAVARGDVVMQAVREDEAVEIAAFGRVIKRPALMD